MSKYKVGDRVRIVKEKKGYRWNAAGEMDKWLGKIMTINEVNEDKYHMKEDAGESHQGTLSGWAWFEEMIEGLANNQKIVITTDGKETLARLYEDNKVIKAAKASCSSEDRFDFEIGAKIAFERLMPTEKINTSSTIEVGDTVRVINSGDCYTTYHGWFKIAKINIEIAARYKYNELVENNTKGKILAKHKHEHEDTMIYCIEDSRGNVYLIGEEGIVKEDK